MPAHRPQPRLPLIEEERMTPQQRALLASLRAGPRGQALKPRGPFAAWMHAPEFGQLAQSLGAHVRYKTALSPRLSEFAILCTAAIWKAQYEWFAHAPMALKAGVGQASIDALREGRVPEQAQPDERAIYEFVMELYKTRRVSEPTYRRVHDFLGDAAMVEFLGILGYYALISMTLNVFHMLPPEAEPLAFAEPDV
ncbi:MAG TPA: carboxymuconolactone decarboxylase family protein [Rhodanobacteraceae bacterium]|nr:carboxymuconolactone decarboxylase family protein [Rhodanobacteraceae bacterium]